MGADRTFTAGSEEVGATAHPDAPGYQCHAVPLVDGLSVAAVAERISAVFDVQRFFYRWRDAGLWQTINHFLVMRTREAAGRAASPTAGVLGFDRLAVAFLKAAPPTTIEGSRNISALR
jgi:hypothetical protein